MRYCVVISIFLVCLLACGSNAASDVVDLSPSNFDKLVLTSDLPYMVEFFAPWCGHCKKLAPEWEKAATNLKGILSLGKVDCTVHPNLCGKYGVQGYPTIKVFSDKGQVFDYNQEREASAIVRYATGAIKSNVHEIASDKALQSFSAAKPELPHVILFTSKDKPTPLYKSLQVQNKEKVVFGFVSQSSKAIVDKFSVTSFPSLLQVVAEGENKVLEGATTSDGLRTAVADLAKTVKTSSSSSSSSSSGKEEVLKEEKKPAAPKPKPATTWGAVFPANVDSECTEVACVIAFADSSNAEQKAILDALLVAYGKEKKFKLVTAQTDLRSKFNLSGAEPTLVVYHAHKQRFAVADAFTEAAAHRLLDRVLGGDVKYTKLEL